MGTTTFRLRLLLLVGAAAETVAGAMGVTEFSTLALTMLFALSVMVGRDVREEGGLAGDVVLTSATVVVVLALVCSLVVTPAIHSTVHLVLSARLRVPWSTSNTVLARLTPTTEATHIAGPWKSHRHAGMPRNMHPQLCIPRARETLGT